MLIDFHEAQLRKFLQLAHKIEAEPSLYVQFDSVSDFYKATWLRDFPQGTVYYASGLDDGAEEFDAVIQYRQAKLYLHCGHTIRVRLIVSDG